MAASISERIYIRWLPDECKEPTYTLVLTTAKRFFVDLRVLITPPCDLYWGFAGISYKSESGDTGRWLHTIDSRNDDTVEDSGTFEQLENGDWLEKGKMLDFDDGKVKEYEEVWRDYEPNPKMATVLVLEEEAGKRFTVGEGKDMAKGMVVRLGRYCQGIMKVKGVVTAERWVLHEGATEWSRVFRCGDEKLPCMVACIDHFLSSEKEEEEEGVGETEESGNGDEVELRTEVHNGDEVRVGDYKWRMVEKSSW